MSYPSVSNKGFDLPPLFIIGQVYQYKVLKTDTSNAIYNTNNPAEYYDHTNATSQDTYYFYGSFVATSAKYSYNTTLNIPPYGNGGYNLTITGASFALPLTFPSNASSQSN